VLTIYNIEKLASIAKNRIESTYTGQDQKGYTIKTTVNIEVTEQTKIHYKSDLVLEINDGKFRNGKTLQNDGVLGQSAKGQTQSGLIEMASIKAFEENFPGRNSENVDNSMANATAHEVGHSGGLDHIDDPRLISYDPKAQANNLMRSKNQSTSTPTLTPTQLSEISKTIKK
jgi:hypothetical protein